MLGEAFHFCRLIPLHAPRTSLLMCMAVNWSQKSVGEGIRQYGAAADVLKVDSIRYEFWLMPVKTVRVHSWLAGMALFTLQTASLTYWPHAIEPGLYKQ